MGKMERIEISREIKEYLKLSQQLVITKNELVKKQLYDSVCLSYEDVSDLGVFGVDFESIEEPFFGLFFCKSDGNEKLSDTHDYDINIRISIEHAHQIYQFLKKVFCEEDNR
jgi:hypothetical protein